MAERYKIYEKLGMGGVGAVFRAYDSQLKRWVAVKRLLSANEADTDKNVASELRREADALASLRNPNIVTIFDVGSDDEGLFIVMELLQGEDLADVVARGPLPYDDFKELASQTLEGLLAAHQHHILHRDIKPENIKVERLPGGRMQAKIIDFGLARAGLRARKQTEDQEGTVMGSIYYMAPEQLTREPVDERTDLYSLGCVFYEALSGRKAFDGKSMAEVIDKHIDHVLLPLHQIAPHVPQWLGAWCARLMAQKPSDRPANAQQAIEEFRAWEKMPTMVPYGPWMGMYAPPPPVYMPPGTSTVPLTGYYHPMTAQVQPMVYAEPVMEVVPGEFVDEGQNVTELAAITTPLAPAPYGHEGGYAVEQQYYATEAPPAAPNKSKLIQQISMIAGAIALLAIGFFVFGSSKKPADANKPAYQPQSAPSNPSKVSFQLPQDRAFPPVDAGISLFYVGNTGNVTNRKGGDGKPATANNNEPVIEWHDLSELGGDNILRVYQKNLDYAPKRINWPEAPTGGGSKPGRVVLDFHARNGKPCMMELDSTGSETQSLPFGNKALTLPNDKGFTAIIAFQADASKIPVRVFSFGNDDGTTLSLMVDEKKNLVTEVKNEGGSPRMVSKDVNGTIPCLAFITWNAKTGDVELRARDADGKSFISSGGKSNAPKKPLNKLLIGRAFDSTGTSVVPQDQFSGYLAEFFVYSVALQPNQIQLIDGRTRDYYFQSAPPPPLTSSLKTKLPMIEPRSKWKLNASLKKDECSKAVDNNTGTRWLSGVPMKGGEWFTVELPAEENIAGLALDCQANTNDYPRKYKIELSSDGTNWNPPIAEGDGGVLTEIVFKAPQKARFVRITQTGSSTGSFWSINELVLFKK